MVPTSIFWVYIQGDWKVTDYLIFVNSWKQYILSKQTANKGLAYTIVLYIFWFIILNKVT